MTVTDDLGCHHRKRYWLDVYDPDPEPGERGIWAGWIVRDEHGDMVESFVTRDEARAWIRAHQERL